MNDFSRNSIIPVIMAGGSGTRLWPVSREAMPKQFIALLEGGLSTFQQTLLRIADQTFASPIVVTSNDFRFVVAEQMKSIAIEGEIVLEPERRDSAAAVAISALLSQKRDVDAVCLVLAADHVITDNDKFITDCRKAAVEAGKGRIMTLGVVPTGPSTAYGYIQCGAALETPDAFAVDRFVEKPKLEDAERYVANGLLWNCGNFIFRADVMMQELESYVPDVVTAASTALDKGLRDLDFLRLNAEAFSLAPKVSIDYAVMEKTLAAGVVKASFGWSDVGSWDSIYDIKTADAQGNVLEGAVSVIDTHGSLIRSEGPLTTIVGLSDIVVVTLPDAVLVSSKSAAPRVKDLVAQLRLEGYGEATDHLRVHRPWGWYQRIDLGDRFQVKHICVHPGGTLSLQRHYHRAEHWVVVHGTAEVTIDGVVRHYHENEAAYLPIGCVHRMRNPGKIDLKIIEVQVGSYTGEDDIVRIEDVYART